MLKLPRSPSKSHALHFGSKKKNLWLICTFPSSLVPSAGQLSPWPPFTPSRGHKCSHFDLPWVHLSTSYWTIMKLLHTILFSVMLTHINKSSVELNLDQIWSVTVNKEMFFHCRKTLKTTRNQRHCWPLKGTPPRSPDFISELHSFTDSWGAKPCFSGKGTKVQNRDNPLCISECLRVRLRSNWTCRSLRT